MHKGMHEMVLPDSSAVAKTDRGQPGRFRKILVVEDEPIAAADLTEQLRRLNYELIGPAESGEKALAFAEETRPDLVLMDIHLEGQIDGVEAAAQITKRFGTPIIFTTAFADPPTLERAKKAEPYGYLLKPFQIRNLATTLEMSAHKHQAIVERQLAEARLAAVTSPSTTLAASPPSS